MAVAHFATAPNQLRIVGQVLTLLFWMVPSDL